MTPRRCAYPGCTTYIERGSYCAAHRPKDKRPPAAARGYDAEWRRVRKLVLEAFPLCQVCGVRRAIQVHHVQPLSRGGSHALSNLLAVCGECHAAITAAQQRERAEWQGGVGG